jgi:hypothetical protein
MRLVFGNEDFDSVFHKTFHETVSAGTATVLKRRGISLPQEPPQSPAFEPVRDLPVT